MEQKQYKRQYREMDDATKQKVSHSLKGRSKTPTHCQAISNGLKKAWERIPSRNNDSSNDNCVWLVKKSRDDALLDKYYHSV